MTEKDAQPHSPNAEKNAAQEAGGITQELPRATVNRREEIRRAKASVKDAKQEVKRAKAGVKEAKTSGKRSKKRRRKQFPWVAIVLLICFAVSVLGGVKAYRDFLVPVDSDSEEVVEVEIPNGAVVSDMGDLLKARGIIRSSQAFDLYVRVKGTAGNLQAGVHRLSPSMTLSQVVVKLQEGAQEAGLTKIAVQEGLTVDQIGDVIADSTSFSKEDFLNLMTDRDFLGTLVQDYPFLETSYNAEGVRYVLEGYLFPATYDFNEEEGLEGLVRQMLDKMQTVVDKYQSQIDSSSYSLQDIMSIASLVEKEGGTGEDRKLIAGVFYNRLAQNMPIQSDISVLYALNTHKEVVTYEDLEVDSPYNLYKNAGLPPGPMNNPGEEAIQAALEPEASNYLYFYANIKTGEVFYTDSYEQHQAWQKEYEETGDIKDEGSAAATTDDSANAAQ
ncbi:MAG: endolytic transglycosylase MltG [Peptococcaceae bacterium]|nr:endolytic transglycosylase MltG [Peptococcaceae bacterium]